MHFNTLFFCAQYFICQHRFFSHNHVLSLFLSVEYFVKFFLSLIYFFVVFQIIPILQDKLNGSKMSIFREHLNKPDRIQWNHVDDCLLARKMCPVMIFLRGSIITDVRGCCLVLMNGDHAQKVSWEFEYKLWMKIQCLLAPRESLFTKVDWKSYSNDTLRIHRQCEFINLIFKIIFWSKYRLAIMQYELKLIEHFYWLELHTISLIPPNLAAGGSTVGVIEQTRTFSLLHWNCMKHQSWWRHNVKDVSLMCHRGLECFISRHAISEKCFNNTVE